MNTQIKHTENKPLVAIHCMVYNHAPFLRECFDGFVMQQTTFPFVAIVHDDASTDGSADIIREYEAKYPHIFKPIYQMVNQHSIPGVSVVQTINNAIQETGAKYIAMCEGDDYWTDPLKLQKQVDFLESNLEYSFCCHRFKILKNEENQLINEYAHKLYTEGTDLIIDERIFFQAWTTQWLTTMVRTDVFCYACNTVLKQFHRCLDVYIYFVLLQKGNGISLNRSMGVYRWHTNGASIGRTDYQRMKDGYVVSENLLKAFPNKSILRNRIKYYGMRFLGYCKCFTKKDINFYRRNMYLWENIFEHIQAIIIFLLPPFIWCYIRRLYSKYIFKE